MKKRIVDCITGLAQDIDIADDEEQKRIVEAKEGAEELVAVEIDLLKQRILAKSTKLRESQTLVEEGILEQNDLVDLQLSVDNLKQRLQEERKNAIRKT
jgi:hypothetical protein